MKQLNVFCSLDLEPRVVTAFDHAGVEGFVRIGGATGNVFQPQGQVPRMMTWEATVFVVPGATPAQVDAITRELRDYSRSCEIEPCMRIVTVPAEKHH